MMHWFLKLAAVAGLVLCLAHVGLAQTTSGNITANETWSGTVTLTGDVIVTGGTLTISPGATVKFATANGNVVYGSSSRINLVAKEAGAIQAVGTASQPITFTTEAATPAPGSWGMLQLVANEARSTFSYCVIEYCGDGFNLDNGDTSLHTQSAPTIDHCIIKKVAGSGIFASYGSNVSLNNCVFEDCTIAIFYDGSGTNAINNCYIYRTSCAMVLAGRATPTLNVSINHCSIYDVSMAYTANAQWWTGYGIYCCNTAGQITLRNTIVQQVDLYGLAVSGWTMTSSNNCWFGTLLPVSGGNSGAESLQVDPLYLDAPNGDLRLDSGSPCLNTASDGTNRGAWQSADTWPVFTSPVHDRAAAPQAQLPVALANPLRNGAEIGLAGGQASVYDMQGNLQRSWTGKVRWNGQGLQSGIYLLKVTSGSQTFSRQFVITR